MPAMSAVVGSEISAQSAIFSEKYQTLVLVTAPTVKPYEAVDGQQPVVKLLEGSARRASPFLYW